MSLELQQETRSQGRLPLQALYAASATRYTSERDKGGEAHSGRVVASTGSHIGSIMTEMLLSSGSVSQSAGCGTLSSGGASQPTGGTANTIAVNVGCFNAGIQHNMSQEDSDCWSRLLSVVLFSPVFDALGRQRLVAILPRCRWHLHRGGPDVDEHHV